MSSTKIGELASSEMKGMESIWATVGPPHLHCQPDAYVQFSMLAMAEITMLMDCTTLSQEEWCQGKEGFLLLVLLYPWWLFWLYITQLWQEIPWCFSVDLYGMSEWKLPDFEVQNCRHDWAVNRLYTSLGDGLRLLSGQMVDKLLSGQMVRVETRKQSRWC